LDKVGESFSIRSKLTPEQKQQAAASLRDQQKLYKGIQGKVAAIKEEKNDQQLDVLQKELAELQMRYKQYEFPERQLTAEQAAEYAKEKPSYDRPSEYFKEYKLLTYDADGTAQLYDFNDAFVGKFVRKMDESQSQSQSQSHKPKFTAGHTGVKKHEHHRFKQQTDVSKLLAQQQQELMAPAARRRRLAPAYRDGSNHQSAYTDRMPDQAVGMLITQRAGKDYACTGTVIAVKEGPKWSAPGGSKSFLGKRSKKKYTTAYVYVLTAGHCVYHRDVDDPSAGVKDPRRFPDGLSFVNSAFWVDWPTEDWPFMRSLETYDRVWVPCYVRPGGNHDLIPDDYAVIKFVDKYVEDDDWKKIHEHYGYYGAEKKEWKAPTIPKFEGEEIQHIYSDVFLVGIYDGVKKRVDSIKPMDTTYVLKPRDPVWYRNSWKKLLKYLQLADLIDHPETLRRYMFSTVFSKGGVSGSPIFDASDPNKIVAVLSSGWSEELTIMAMLLEEQIAFINAFTNNKFEELCRPNKDAIQEIGKHQMFEDARSNSARTSLKNEWDQDADEVDYMQEENTFYMTFWLLGTFCMLSISVGLGSVLCGFVTGYFYLHFKKSFSFS